MDGVLIINKPSGMTSHDVVARVRRILNERSVGHLGTLDPSAKGVLPLVVGRFTRLAAFYSEADKRYEGVIRFGVATDTYDADGEPLGAPERVGFSPEELREAAARFVGKIQQAPPPFSAKKIAGVPAYRLARKKQDFELKPKEVEVKELEIVSFDGVRAHFRAWVSSGTYLRSLAHDLGQALGTGAHLEGLTRTAVREFRLEEAHGLEELEAKSFNLHNTSYQTLDQGAAGNEGLQSLFLHPRLVLPEFPAITAPPEALVKIRHGNAVNLPYFPQPGAPTPHHAQTQNARVSGTPAAALPTLARVFENQTRLIAIARRIAGTLFHPKVVLI
ncbi:MAG TPA: tRNA pseudouridine(55) synthase TruB [Candidatus Angelobacter sp.]|nr:tRNA pseudouridine(55) synthase TruB [Candidatus Angelobacter sp.]